MKWALIFLATLLSNAPLAEETALDLLFKAGKYEEAITSLRSVESAHSQDPAYFYNLGNLYYHLGKFGLSLAYFEKAYHLSPAHLDVQTALAQARKETSKRLGQEHLDPSSNWAETIADQINLDLISILLEALVFVFSLFWFRSYLKERDPKKAALQAPSLLTLLGLFFLLFFLFVQEQSGKAPPAYCLSSQSVHSGPGEKFLELSRVDPGVKIRLLGPSLTSEAPESKVWRQIRYSKSEIGWIPESSLLLFSAEWSKPDT